MLALVQSVSDPILRQYNTVTNEKVAPLFYLQPIHVKTHIFLDTILRVRD